MWIHLSSSYNGVALVRNHLTARLKRRKDWIDHDSPNVHKLHWNCIASWQIWTNLSLRLRWNLRSSSHSHAPPSPPHFYVSSLSIMFHCLLHWHWRVSEDRVQGFCSLWMRVSCCSILMGLTSQNNVKQRDVGSRKTGTLLQTVWDRVMQDAGDADAHHSVYYSFNLNVCLAELSANSSGFPICLLICCGPPQHKHHLPCIDYLFWTQCTSLSLRLFVSHMDFISTGHPGVFTAARMCLASLFSFLCIHFKRMVPFVIDQRAVPLP